MQAAPFARPLLATGHTPFDSGAERVALELARHCALPLAVVMPIESNPEYMATAPEVAAAAEAALAERRAAFAAEAAAAGVAIEVQVRHGPEPWREIVDAAREAGADLIVLRRRGQRGWLANLLLGDMVHKVLSHASCPVLVNLREARMWTRGVLAALDPQAPEPHVLAAAAAVARRCGLPLTLAGAGGSVEALEALAAPLRTGGLAVACRVEAARTVHAALLDAAAAAGADLIVAGRHRGDRLARAWVGGTAQKLIGLATCPVLVVPPPPEGNLP